MINAAMHDCINYTLDINTAELFTGAQPYRT